MDEPIATKIRWKNVLPPKKNATRKYCIGLNYIVNPLKLDDLANLCFCNLCLEQKKLFNKFLLEQKKEQFRFNITKEKVKRK